jgi:hypothetical protein
MPTPSWRHDPSRWKYGTVLSYQGKHLTDPTAFVCMLISGTPYEPSFLVLVDNVRPQNVGVTWDGTTEPKLWTELVIL